ncbi:MAG: transglycosylase SLT domain-containing protein [Xanthomonadales bacterium]|nr:transglycosylase SLT domain-containing protein [Xanthomonadales bacterium]
MRHWFLPVVLAFAGCATPSPRGEVPGSASAGDEVAAALSAFEVALENWHRGAANAGGEDLTRSRLALDAAVTACLQVETCDAMIALRAQSTANARMAHALLGEREVDPLDQVEALITTDRHAHAGTPAGDVSELARSAAMLNGKRLDEVIRLNGAVKAGIEEWLTWMRPNLLDAYEHYQYLRHRMWPVYEQAGLPEALLFGILAKESGGKVHAVSRAGAAGLLQFMPATARGYGLGRASGFDDRFDPTLVTRANVAFLNDRFRELNNDLELALGAYNGGEGRMRRLSGNGSRGFWDGPVYNAVPPETRDYVPMVLAAAWLFLHPQDYGLEFPTFDARPAAITLERTASINELAVCMGQFGNARGWFRTLRNLNPKYEADTRIEAGVRLEVPGAAAKAYEARCRSGLLAQTAAELNAARPPASARASWVAASASSGGRTHVVRKGETLNAIARRFGCGVPAVAAANGLRPPSYAIRAGQRLRVPSCRA